MLTKTLSCSHCGETAQTLPVVTDDGEQQRWCFVCLQEVDEGMAEREAAWAEEPPDPEDEEDEESFP